MFARAVRQTSPCFAYVGLLLRDVERNDTDASKPVERHFNIPNHFHHNMAICALSLHHGNTKSRKNLERKFIFQLSCHNSANGKSPPHPHKNQEHNNSCIRSGEGLTLETSAFQIVQGGNSTFIKLLIKPDFPTQLQLLSSLIGVFTSNGWRP